jgi:hypothetical protein
MCLKILILFKLVSKTIQSYVTRQKQNFLMFWDRLYWNRRCEMVVPIPMNLVQPSLTALFCTAAGTYLRWAGGRHALNSSEVLFPFRYASKSTTVWLDRFFFYHFQLRVDYWAMTPMRSRKRTTPKVSACTLWMMCESISICKLICVCCVKQRTVCIRPGKINLLVIHHFPLTSAGWHRN